MRAKAYTVLADCRRMAADLEGARQAIAEAWRWNEEGEGDPLDKAEIYFADAAYAAMIGEFETAVTILKRALSLYRAADDAHLQGRTLIRMGEAIGYVKPEKALAYIERALERINPVREPRLAYQGSTPLRSSCAPPAGRGRPLRSSIAPGPCTASSRRTGRSSGSAGSKGGSRTACVSSARRLTSSGRSGRSSASGTSTGTSS